MDTDALLAIAIFIGTLAAGQILNIFTPEMREVIFAKINISKKDRLYSKVIRIQSQQIVLEQFKREPFRMNAYFWFQLFTIGRLFFVVFVSEIVANITKLALSKYVSAFLYTIEIILLFWCIFLITRAVKFARMTFDFDGSMITLKSGLDHAIRARDDFIRKEEARTK
jgi:hypothetical protein